MKIEPEALSRLLTKAIAAGAVQESLLSWTWDISGDCLDPAEIVYHAGVRERANFKQVPSRQICIKARCRWCDACRAARANMWIARAFTEFQTSQRVWFVSLTATPDWHFVNELLCKDSLARSTRTWADLSEDQKFVALTRRMGVEITLFLKRLRKSSGAKLRYMLVFEAHKSGRPHAHILIHETEGSEFVRKKHIKQAWRAGFCDCKLKDVEIAYYICKYISKSRTRARVRASNRYGRNTPRDSEA